MMLEETGCVLAAASCGFTHREKGEQTESSGRSERNFRITNRCRVRYEKQIYFSYSCMKNELSFLSRRAVFVNV